MKLAYDDWGEGKLNGKGQRKLFEMMKIFYIFFRVVVTDLYVCQN